MIETKFQFKKTVGLVLLTIGFLGIGYLVWVYKVYPGNLPVFPKDSVLSQEGIPISDGTGFAGLFVNDSQDIASQIMPTTDPNYSVDVNRVLGSQTEKNYNTDQVSLSIPRLGIEKAKVALDVDGNDERIYNGILLRAIAHLKKSAYPGQYGNMFLFGHSRLPVLAGTGYEAIFTDLPQIRIGDIVKVYDKGVEYTYQITQTGVVEPSDVFITNQPPTKKMITLMTCIPPGFASQRYITVGELIASTKG